MRLFVLFVTFLLMPVVVTTTTQGEADRCDNRAFVVERFGLSAIPEAEQSRLVGPIEARLAEFCLESLISQADHETGFPVVGDNLMLFEFVRLYPVKDLKCSNVDYAHFRPAGGPGGHYDEAVELPDEWSGQMPWSYGAKEYVGTASSTFSDAANARETEAYVIDLDSGKAFAYSQPIRYQGVSDFFCVHFEMGFIHHFLVFNTPFVSGTVLAEPAGAVPLVP